MNLIERLRQYAYLMRLDKPIGLTLLLWPTLWGLWLASDGRPLFKHIVIFTAGVFFMRAAGCIVNDIADRHIDPYVERTKHRPLASGKVSLTEALMLAGILGLCAFTCVLFCNALTIALAVVGALLALTYPLLKRVTHLPQLGLGLAFAWGIPMAFAAETGRVSGGAWLLFAAAALWPVSYDTMYAMVDREDDLKIGVKSTAILFANSDTFIIAIIQALFVGLLWMVGIWFHLHTMFYVSVMAAVALSFYQQWLIKDRVPSACFRAFLNNHWLGFILFIGIYTSYLV